MLTAGTDDLDARLHLHPFHSLEAETHDLHPVETYVLVDEFVALSPVALTAIGDSASTDHAARLQEMPKAEITSGGALAFSWPDAGAAARTVPLLLREAKLGFNPRMGRPMIVLESETAFRIWLILVDGSVSVARRVLVRMGQLGAIRVDFDEAYVLQREPLGSGSNATVYGMMERVRGGRRRANHIVGKVLLKEAAGANGDQVSQSLRQEVAMLAAAQGHPHIVRFHGLFHRGGRHDEEDPASSPWVLVMENGNGGDLFEAVAKGIFAEDRARAALRGLLSALAHTHLRQIVHRDVKPENVLLAGDGRVLLADFGIACHLQDEQEMERRCGSPGYAAPEIIGGRPYGAKVDCFSAGSLLFYLICGRSPFEGPNIASTLRRTQRGHVDLSAIPLFRAISSDCKEMIMMLLQPDPTNRVSAGDAQHQPFFIARHSDTNNANLSARGTRADQRPPRPPAADGQRPSGSFSTQPGRATAQACAAAVQRLFRRDIPERSTQAGAAPTAAPGNATSSASWSSLLPRARPQEAPAPAERPDPRDSTPSFSDMAVRADDPQQQPSRAGGSWGRSFQQLISGRSSQTENRETAGRRPEPVPPASEPSGRPHGRDPEQRASGSGSWLSSMASSSNAGPTAPRQKKPASFPWRRKPTGAASSQATASTVAASSTSLSAEVNSGQSSPGVSSSQGNAPLPDVILEEDGGRPEPEPEGVDLLLDLLLQGGEDEVKVDKQRQEAMAAADAQEQTSSASQGPASLPTATTPEEQTSSAAQGPESLPTATTPEESDISREEVQRPAGYLRGAVARSERG